ncbi:MAG: hypothetical protein ACK40S_03485 [Burkholderiaceae bacterium]
MVEDTTDKIRRNLVVFSGTYLALWFLGISWPDFIRTAYLEKVGAAVDPSRLQWVVFVVFCYLGFRWLTCEEYERGKTKALEAWKTDTGRHVQDYVQRQLERTLPESVPTWISFPTGSDLSSIQRWWRDVEGSAAGRPFIREVTANNVASVFAGGQFIISCRPLLKGQRESFATVQDARVDFMPPRWLVWAAGATAVMQALLREPTWAWVLPNLLAAVTLLRMVWRFI